MLSVSLALAPLGCAPYDPPADRSGQFAPCCAGRGVCAPSALLPDAARQQLGADACGASLACVPTRWAEGARFVPTPCRSLAGAEGRCVPDCLAAAAHGSLPRDVCPPAELCAPCFDPLTGQETSVCRLGGDPGPQQAPALFASCCGDLGRCVPHALIAANQRDQLAPDSCDPKEALCVPVSWASDREFVAVSCTSVASSEGRCLPSCLPELAAQAGRLPSAGCPAQHLCAPCFDPATGRDTGACRVGADHGPQQSPPSVERCCGALGVCLSAESVPRADQSRLSRQSCTLDTALCVPSEWAEDARFIPQSCRSLGDLEGRCLPACLPEMAAQAARLPRSGCPDGSLCAPCFDPIDGRNTRACNIGSDPGPREPAPHYARCCGELGRCMPRALLSELERAQLGAEGCTQPDTLCVPDAWARDPQFVPAQCTSLAGSEGRCLPSCLPGITRTPTPLPRDTCAHGHTCAPCFDPVRGSSTGACSLGADPGPRATPAPPRSCCAGVGRCLAADLVPAAQRGRLPREECSEQNALCVPEAWALDASFAPASCRSLGNVEGRCLPACLPELAASLTQLPQSGCPPEHRCAPCFDPLSGEATGACNLTTDSGPREPAQPFASCCHGAGRCVPATSVPIAERRRLASDNCAEPESLCAPETWARDVNAAPSSCRSIGGSEGRCLPRCLPELASRAARLPESTCPAEHVCAPCYDPVTSAATGACSVGGDPGPRETAKPLAACCLQNGESAGVCVPSTSLSEAEIGRLPKDLCSDPGTLCAPRALVNPAAASLGRCQAGTGVRGACVPACFLSVLQNLALGRDSCRGGESCVPCDLLGLDATSCQ